MLVFILLSLIYRESSSYFIPIPNSTFSKELIQCVTNIVTDYLAPQKVFTYISSTGDDHEFLQTVHDSNLVTILSKRSSNKHSIPHKGYFIVARNYSIFIERFPKLLKEASWNPEARFLILVKSLEVYQLKPIFNRLLKQHVNNVVVVNATADAHLYTYNPFDNYGCGKRYDEIINYGKCSEAQSQNLYPNKFVTELHNCTFTVAIPHWPPYTIFPNENSNARLTRYSYGMETYFLRLIGDMAGFSLEIILDKQSNMTYSIVTADMEATGQLQILQNNKADAVIGGLILVPSRAVVFSYVYDLLPFVDEIQFLVRRASNVPSWKNSYLEFSATVWFLIFLAFGIYAMMLMILLRAEDKSLIVMKLLDHLLGHGCRIETRPMIKAVFLMWVWFAYLINAFYQSNLVSLTTHPAKENQISTEADILRHKLKPCFSFEIDSYYSESLQSHVHKEQLPFCKNASDSIRKVVNSNEYYTMYMYGLLQYYPNAYMDEYGNPLIYSLKEPYSKIIYCMYFYKGFPLIRDIQFNALKIREMGLVEKAFSDMYYLRIIKIHYSARSYESRLVIPWFIYIIGCVAAAITLVVEKLSAL